MRWWRGKPWVSKARESPKDPGNPGQESLWVNRTCEPRDRVGLSPGQEQREGDAAALLPRWGLLRIHIPGTCVQGGRNRAPPLGGHQSRADHPMEIRGFPATQRTPLSAHLLPRPPAPGYLWF